MRLKVLVPTGVVLDEEVTKVVAEAASGSFCLLPRHIDFLAALVPGLLAFTAQSRAGAGEGDGAGEGEEQFLAIGQGLLVKREQEILVTTGQAVLGGDLGQLRKTVVEEFATLDERQHACQSAIAKLEANFLRRFLELQES